MFTLADRVRTLISCPSMELYKFYYLPCFTEIVICTLYSLHIHEKTITSNYNIILSSWVFTCRTSAADDMRHTYP